MVALSSRLPDPVVGLATIKTVTLSLDTNAYADNDVLADMQEVTDFVRAEGGKALIYSVTVLDKDDQGQAMDIIISSGSGALGTENDAVSVSDANAEGMQAISIVAADYVDLINSQIATKTGINLVVEAAAGSTSIYVGAIVRSGTPTHTASGVQIRFGLLLY